MQLAFQHTFAHRTSLVVSPQLRQAIVILQMCNAELAQFIAQEAEENPFLDVGVPAPETLLPAGRSLSSMGDDDWDRMAGLPDHAPSLWSHVAAQVGALGLSAKEISLAAAFMDALEPSGWLGESLETIASIAAVEVEVAESMLRRLQSLDPAGIFARNLSECLQLQLIAQGRLSEPMPTILRNLPMVASADLTGLARICGVPVESIRVALRILRGLEPKPGAAFELGRDPVRPPDLIVSRAGQNGWRVELNRSTLPAVVLRRDEARRVAPVLKRQGHGSYVSDRLDNARWLARAVDHRNKTLLKIGEVVVRMQDAFMDAGPEYLRPMIMKDVASAASVHESTVSRVAVGNLISTPQGTYPLRHFFTAALPSREEGQGSAGAVRHRIARLIRDERPDAPLSDDQLVSLMKSEGVEVARRTVAKYRTLMDIPSSARRRREAVLSGRA